MLFVGTRAGFEELVFKVRLAAGVSLSPTTILNGPTVPSSSIIWVPTPKRVGALFTGLTVNVKFVLTRFVPSLIDKVMRADPLSLAAGAIVTVRLLPLPPRPMRLVGTRTGFEEI